MALTTEQRAILAHTVVDPDAWMAHAVETFGADATTMLENKVARIKPEYEAEKAKPAYKTRAERDAEAAVVVPLTILQQLAATDAILPRILEDGLDAVIALGGVVAQPTMDNLAAKKTLRGQL